MASTFIIQVMMLSLAHLSSGVDAQPHSNFLRKVSTQDIVNGLESSLSDILSGHASAVATKRLAAIEASLWKTFQSLPKNSNGRLAPAAVRYIVHGYFGKEHGWQIKGLEAQGVQVNASSSKVHDASILQEKAPLLVEGLLEARHQDHGLAFTDIVAMVSVLEQLVIEESVTLLEAAYRLNGKSVDAHLDEMALQKVLKSYLVLFGQGSKANLDDVAQHQALLERRSRKEVEDFASNAVLNFDYMHQHKINPFVPRQYSFAVASEIVTDVAHRYGKWQNAQCNDMKAHLVELDPEGSGRVPLGLLYAQPTSAAYRFSESSDYLRKVGALDETSSIPKVLITNYILGPSNCVASSSYYSVCCLNHCDSIMDEIEHKVLAPTASPERLLSIVQDISHVQALPRGLAEKLHNIAERHGGEVPLHGRLFAQWLHFAFPHECPYPSIVESADMLARSQWNRTQYSASSDERLTHVLSVDDIALAGEDMVVDKFWTDHEVLPMHDGPQSPLGRTATVMRATVQLAALFLGLRSILAAWRAATGVSDSKGKANSKKDDDFAIGFRV
jgi:hypothetical protein